ncbi:hypothetical protein, partial [Escherichia coli]
KTSIFSHPVYLFLRKFSLQDSRGGSASRLTEAVAVFRIQQQQRETSAVVKTVTPAAPRKMAVADSEENWETF